MNLDTLSKGAHFKKSLKDESKTKFFIQLPLADNLFRILTVADKHIIFEDLFSSLFFLVLFNRIG